MTAVGNEYSAKAAQECIKRSVELIEQSRKLGGKEGAKESNIRHNFTSYLRLLFPSVPWWVEDHISRGEANSAFSVSGKARVGFVDNLVGMTAIEYETDLENRVKFEDGFRQIRNYCASLVNKGNAPDLVIGVLSDTVRWRAYKIRAISPATGMLGGDHVELEELDQINLSSADELAARKLASFLIRYLGRKGSRPLSAFTIARDLGFESDFCKARATDLRYLVEKAFNRNPKYADLIAKLWCSFVTYLRDRGSRDTFEIAGYADELYILTVAKLICANVLMKKALLSDDKELRTILDGHFFRSRGITNLVEYDYFGWLNRSPYIETLLPIARALQADLEAYDFLTTPAEDLFGELLAQLARRTQRLLLGQEWTPGWLARQLVDKVLAMLPADAEPQLVDMCCGSGAMIIEAVKRAKARIASSNADMPAATKLQKLSVAIAGFDIDPLAVMLSKISWVLASQDWLDEASGAASVHIPVYHADSLFAVTPLSHSVDEEGEASFHTLKIAEHTIGLPSFLLSPEFQRLFDAVLERGHHMVMAMTGAPVPTSAIEAAVKSAGEEAASEITSEQQGWLVKFLAEFVAVVDALNRDGRNGIWAFILRNSYRPGLVAGQFNGVVSNPPWLALSKIADNPYKDILRSRAQAFGIKPSGPSHLHIDLATIFLLHAVDRYLRPGAAVGCIAPDTVLNGHHHNPFRLGMYATAERPVEFTPEELWRVQKGTFKNEACVVFGRKTKLVPGTTAAIPGGLIAQAGRTPLSFERIQRGNRVAWVESGSAVASKGFFEPAPFRQGADIMPRTLIFHDVSPAGPSNWKLTFIDRSTSRLAFVIKDAKEHKNFRIATRTVPDRYMFDVLTSNLLSSFELARALKAFLPIEKRAGKWQPVDAVTLAATPAAKLAFDEILAEYGAGKTVTDLFNALDSDRRKLTQQQIPAAGFLVVTGAGGKLVTAAHVPTTHFDVDKLIIDQTLYWAVVATEDEALYLVGLQNSEAINQIIQEFQPRGAFGERHVHTLAHEVTPPFDPIQAAHQDVVEQTRSLIAQYAALKADDQELVDALDPNSSSLSARRRRIRSKLKALPAYDAYELACRNLYGV